MTKMSTEPQSIVHQILRLERKLVKAVSSIARRRQDARRTRELSKSHHGSLQKVEMEDDFTEVTESTGRDSALFSLPGFSDHSSASLESARIGQSADQSERLPDIIFDHSPDEVVFVHFFVKNSPMSEAIDQQLKSLEVLYPQYRYARIEASRAPHIVTRLGAETQKPTVAAFKDGKLLNRISDFSCTNCSELKNWVFAIGLLRMFN